jgi:hypothetical protein
VKGYFVLRFTAPYDNEEEITRFEVLILDKNTSEWREDTTFCDGLSVEKLYCMFPMNYLRSEYSYGFRDLVQAKVRAQNLYGWSRDYS